MVKYILAALVGATGAAVVTDAVENDGHEARAVEAVVEAEAPSTCEENSQVETNADGVDFASLTWCWGGFDGSRAALVADAQISSLKVGGNLTYRWVRGGCEKLGATSREDYGHTVCAAFALCADGTWRGGKFDWISTSRTSRDLKNIEAGYNGWDAAAWRAAKRRAFVIVSADGKKRTNIIVED